MKFTFLINYVTGFIKAYYLHNLSRLTVLSAMAKKSRMPDHNQELFTQMTNFTVHYKSTFSTLLYTYVSILSSK